MKKAAICVTSIFLVLGLLLVSCDGQPPIDKTTPVRNATVDAAKPYDAIHWGLFHDQVTSSTTTPRGGSDIAVTTQGTYSLYIPQGLQPKSRTLLILVPNGKTSKEFASSEIGKRWIDLSYSTKEFAVVFAEPQDGTWNVSLASTGRDERAFMYDLFASIRNKKVNVTNAFLSVDKNGASLIGYGAGADMAGVLAAGWPAMFSNTTLVEPTSFPAVIPTLLDEGAYPYIIDGKKGFGELKNGNIAMPLYISSNNPSLKAHYMDTWSEVNFNAYAGDKTIDRTFTKAVSLNDSDVGEIYQVARANGRFMGYPGGTIRAHLDFSSSRFKTFEEQLDGLLRRWKVYTPASYNASVETPMVVVLHGSSAAISDIAEESRWTDVADAAGCLVTFIQGYPSSSDTATSIPIPAWNMSDASSNNADIKYIETVVERVKAGWNVNSERVYLTGHSLGSMMTTCVAASPISNLFAAYAPVGMIFGTTQYPQGFTLGNKVPTWAFLGQYDMQGSGFTGTGPYAGGGVQIATWATLNGVTDVTTPAPTYENSIETDKFATYTYLDASNAPMAKYTVVKQSPHVYMPEESYLIWNSFFKHFSRLADGTVVYTE